MLRNESIATKEITAASRVAEYCDGSIRATIPADIIGKLALSPGDELRAAIVDDAKVGYYAKGVPFDKPPTFLGNTRIVDHNGSCKTTIPIHAVEYFDISPGDRLKFSTRRLVFYIESR